MEDLGKYSEVLLEVICRVRSRLVGETGAGLLPLALRAPGVLLLHAVYLAAFARLAAYSLGGRVAVDAAVLEDGGPRAAAATGPDPKVFIAAR